MESFNGLGPGSPESTIKKLKRELKGGREREREREREKERKREREKVRKKDRLHGDPSSDGAKVL